MKKMIAAVLVTGIAVTGVGAGNASAATGNTMHNVEQLQNGDTTLEHAKLGDSIQSVLKRNGTPIYSESADGNEHFYEFNKKDGRLVITADGKKNKGHITRISMSYNKTNGPSFEDVKKQLGDDAIYRSNYNSVTGNFGYIQDGNVSYQFSSQSPQDKDIKLYRIDIAK